MKLTVHGDDYGAVLSPKIAPIQVVIIPIPYKDMTEQINKTCKDIEIMLKKANIKVKLDPRADLTPGSKFYYWDLRGVPIRIEVGPKDIMQNEATIVRRDTLEKQTCKINKLVITIPELMNIMMEDLHLKAWEWMDRRVHRVDNLEEAKKLIARRAGIVEVYWCGNVECGHKLEEAIGARVLGVPMDVEEKIDGKCTTCGKDAISIVRVAIAY